MRSDQFDLFLRLGSKRVGVHNRLGKGLRRLLGQVVANAAGDSSVYVFAGEFFGIGAGLRMWRTIGIAFKRDGGHSNDRRFGQPLFKLVILRLAFSQSEAPAVTMDHYLDMIRVVEGRCSPIERSRIEVPFWRRKLPNEPGKITPIFFVAGSAAFGGKIKLIPPFELSLRRQWRLVSGRAADQITANGDHSFAAFRPKRANDVGGARSPIETTDHCLIDLESIHQGNDVERE